MFFILAVGIGKQFMDSMSRLHQSILGKYVEVVEEMYNINMKNRQ